MRPGGEGFLQPPATGAGGFGSRSVASGAANTFGPQTLLPGPSRFVAFKGDAAPVVSHRESYADDNDMRYDQRCDRLNLIIDSVGNRRKTKTPSDGRSLLSSHRPSARLIRLQKEQAGLPCAAHTHLLEGTFFSWPGTSLRSSRVHSELHFFSRPALYVIRKRQFGDTKQAFTKAEFGLTVWPSRQKTNFRAVEASK